jgi:hypothetical protein
MVEQYHVVDLHYENLVNRLKDANLTIYSVDRSEYNTEDGPQPNYYPLNFLLEGTVDGKNLFIRASSKSMPPFYGIHIPVIDQANIDGVNLTNKEAMDLVFEFMPYLSAKAKEQYETVGSNPAYTKIPRITKL